MSDPARETFLRLDKLVRQYMRQSSYASRGRTLLTRAFPPLPSKAETQIHNAEEFDDLARQLFPTSSTDRLQRIFRSGLVRGRLADALRRSGYYHGVLSGVPAEEFWPSIREDVSRGVRHFRRLLLLEGCRLPKDRFAIGDISIIRFSKDEVAKFGPDKEICNSFFPKEVLNSEWYSQYWFLVEAKTESDDPSKHHWPFEYVSADVRLNYYWKPLLVLSLFSRQCFRIPTILESEEGWKLDTIQFSEPLTDRHIDDEGNDHEVPWSQYTVNESDSPRFDSFCLLCEEPLKKCAEWAPIQIAARRYLRGMFLSDPAGSGDHKDVEEDILLQYIMTLEALLTGMTGREFEIRLRVLLLCSAAVAMRRERQRVHW